MKKQIIFFTFLIMFSGCMNKPKELEDSEVARFGNQILTENQLKTSGFFGTTDSAEYVRTKINEWIIRQALLEKAYENLGNRDKDIENQVNEYRNTLYIHKHRQLLLSKKIDTLISTTQIQEYYNKFKEELTLNYPIVQAYVIKLASSNLQQDEILKLLRMNDEKSLTELKTLCYQNSTCYMLNPKWIPLSNLLDMTSLTSQTINMNNIAKGRIYYNNTDEENVYIKIIDFVKSGEEPPLDFISKKIEEMILRKRKEMFLTKYENELLQEALQHKKAIVKAEE